MKKLFSVCIVFFSLLCIPSYAAGPETILLIPFTNTGDQDCSWIGTGIRENIQRALRENNAVRIISSADIRIARRYTGLFDDTPLKGNQIQSVSSALKADKAVITRYRSSAGKIHIEMEIIRCSDWTTSKIMTIDDLSENIFSIQEALKNGLLSDAPFEYTPPKPVYVTVKRKKKKYTYKKENPYLLPYEWYARGLSLQEKKPAAALDYLIRTLRYDPEHVGALCAAADIAHNKQDIIDGALGYLLRADRISVRYGESGTLRYADLMIRIADIYEHKKDLTRAQIYISRAHEVWNKHKKTRPGEYAEFLSEIAVLYLHNGYKNTAIDYFSSAQQVMEEYSLQDSFRYGWLMKQTAELYEDCGRPEIVEPYYVQAYNSFSRHGLTTMEDYADCEYRLGQLYASRNEKVKAEAMLRDAQRIYANNWLYAKAKKAQKEADDIFTPVKPVKTKSFWTD